MRNEKTRTYNLHYDGLTMKQRNEIEKRIQNNVFDPYDLWSPRTREEYDKMNEEQYKASLEEEEEEEEYESDDSQTQRMKRLEWIQNNRKPKNN